MTAREKIDDFLKCKRLAMVGVSRSKKDFSRLLWREFAKRGYDIVPVNPNLNEVDGRPCYRSVADIAPPVEAALVMTGADSAAGAVEQCAGAGIRRVWLYRATGTGAASPAAVEAGEQAGMAVSTGCPFMFFDRTGFPHNFHRLILRIAGSYPK